MAETRVESRPLLYRMALVVLALLLPLGAAAQEGDEDFIIGVGMAYDHEDFEGPATIAYLYEEFNMGVFEDGDVILEYRGFPVGSGAELHQLILDLPDVAIGDPVEMVLLTADGAVVPAAPVAAAIAPKVHDFTFADRACDTAAAQGCLCRIKRKGSTCIRSVTIEKDENGKIVKTSATCADGVNFCPPAPAKPRRLRGK